MKIVTDSAADMSAAELEQLDVAQAPLFIQFPEGEVSATDISADDFYNRLEAMRPAIPTTAQPSSGIFAELYRKLAEKEKAEVHNQAEHLAYSVEKMLQEHGDKVDPAVLEHQGPEILAVEQLHADVRVELTQPAQLAVLAPHQALLERGQLDVQVQLR